MAAKSRALLRDVGAIRDQRDFLLDPHRADRRARRHQLLDPFAQPPPRRRDHVRSPLLYPRDVLDQPIGAVPEIRRERRALVRAHLAHELARLLGGARQRLARPAEIRQAARAEQIGHRREQQERPRLARRERVAQREQLLVRGARATSSCGVASASLGSLPATSIRPRPSDRRTSSSTNPACSATSVRIRTRTAR